MASIHRTYFNRLAPAWPDSIADESSLINYLREFPLQAGDRILDAGAGTGVLTRLLHRFGLAGLFLVPMDISEQMLAKGKRLSPFDLNHATCADLSFAPFRSELFDKVICYSVFPHLRHPVKVAQELFRLLKPSGRLLVLHSQCSRKLNAMHATLTEPVRHDELMRANELGDWLVQVGFRCIRIRENPGLYWVEVEKSRS